LTNDILRLWRTFCVNYEARTRSEPAWQKAKRKLKNYKLKHSRLLTCYSALLYLLAEFTIKGTVDKTAALAMTRLTPMERVADLPTSSSEATETKAKLVACDEKFLVETDASDDELVGRFMDPERSGDYSNDARLMGDAVHDLLRSVGTDSRFYRLLVVQLTPSSSPWRPNVHGAHPLRAQQLRLREHGLHGFLLQVRRVAVLCSRERSRSATSPGM